MTEQQLREKERKLQAAGYHRFTPSRYEKYDHAWSRKFRDPEDSDHTLYFIAWNVYDFSRYADRDPYIKDHPYSMEVEVYVNHGTKMHLWHRKDYDIETVEKAARDFYELMTKYKFNEEDKPCQDQC